MSNLAFAPGVWVAVLIDAESSVVATLYFDLAGKVVERNVSVDSFWEPSGLLVTKAELAVDIKAPGKQLTTFGDGSGVTEAC